jgi:hypothetical protein
LQRCNPRSCNVEDQPSKAFWHFLLEFAILFAQIWRFCLPSPFCQNAKLTFILKTHFAKLTLVRSYEVHNANLLSWLHLEDHPNALFKLPKSFKIYNKLAIAFSLLQSC